MAKSELNLNREWIFSSSNFQRKSGKNRKTADIQISTNGMRDTLKCKREPLRVLKHSNECKWVTQMLPNIDSSQVYRASVGRFRGPRRRKPGPKLKPTHKINPKLTPKEKIKLRVSHRY